MATRCAARLLSQSMKAAPLAVAGSLVAAAPQSAQCWWGRDAAAKKEAERRAARGPLDILTEYAAETLAAADAGPAALGDKVLKDVGALSAEALATGYPSQISWGFCAGYCTGFAAKKVGKVGFVAVGGLYALLQAAAYHGYVTVDHARISQRFTELADANGDGRVDLQDGRDLYARALEVLEFNGPSGGGFAGGALLGLRSG